jgi:hypothetical protein
VPSSYHAISKSQPANPVSPKYLLKEPGIGDRFADSVEQVLVISSTSDAMRD